MTPDFSTYHSASSLRFGSPDMRKIFSEQHKYQLWRRIWVALAEVQQRAGLVTEAELADLREHEAELNIERLYEIEQSTQHDVVAAIREYAEVAKLGGGKIHLGATSMDINDNADVMRLHEALHLTQQRLETVLHKFAELVERQADLPCLGYTHLQAAEPTTVGYRLAFYAQDLYDDWLMLGDVGQRLRAKGMKGAVGTRASYAAILAGTGVTAAELDREVMERLGLTAAVVTTQVVSRKQEYWVLSALAGVGSSLAKFAADLRLLQSPGFGEWSEPFGDKQVGSSAMPFKKNPLKSEKICSLARYLATLPAVALENASLSYLERTLDDSANRRLILPESFLALDEILLTADKILAGIRFDDQKIAANLATYAPFSATEGIIIAAVKQGADRQAMHELLREIAMRAWDNGRAGVMRELLLEDKTLLKYLSRAQLDALLDVSRHVGDAPERARQLAGQIKAGLKV